VLIVNSMIHWCQSAQGQGDGWLGSVVVGHWTRDREVASLTPGQCTAGYPRSSQPSGVGKSSTSLLAGVKAGRVHVCRAAGYTV